MTTYVLYSFRYRQGNHPPVQSVVEVEDRGDPSQNRDAAEALAKAYVLDLGVRKGIENARLCDVEPFVAASERPSAVTPAKPEKSSLLAHEAQKARPIQPVQA